MLFCLLSVVDLWSVFCFGFWTVDCGLLLSPSLYLFGPRYSLCVSAFSTLLLTSSYGTHSNWRPPSCLNLAQATAPIQSLLTCIFPSQTPLTCWSLYGLDHKGKPTYLLSWYVDSQEGHLIYCGLCENCEARCCFSTSFSSIKTSKRTRDLSALRRLQSVAVPVIFISGTSLCISLPLCVTLLIFSHPACPSSSVSSWRFDSVTAVERRLQSCGGMSAGVRCLSWHHWLLCVWVCVHACVNWMLVCGYCRCSYVLHIDYQRRECVIHFILWS